MSRNAGAEVLMSGLPKNISNFDLVVANLLVILYESFPRPINLNPSNTGKIGFSAVPVGTSDDESWEIGTMIDDVFTFLSEEGFIRYQSGPNNQHGYYWSARLTLKGLTILGSPESLGSKGEPLISKIKASLEADAIAKGTEALRKAVFQIFRMAMEW
ncbi:MAG: hypothetical protein Q7U82_04990 [Gammaproteobacteria bacterium]|nr:hypothetical protein [Gammaproteobacteria bacterium]